MSEAEQARIQALVVKGAATRFQPGTRGGPGRRPGPALPTPQELATPHAPYAIKRLRDLCDSDDENVAVKASMALAKLAEPSDDDKLLRLLEDRLRDLKAEAEERRQAMAAVTGQ